MTGFRLLCCLCLLLFSCSVVCAEAGDDSASPTSIQLQQEKVSLQRKVKRLEAQVAALREEVNSPDATQVFAGLGYVVGIFGVAAWIAARKQSGRGD